MTAAHHKFKFANCLLREKAGHVFNLYTFPPSPQWIELDFMQLVPGWVFLLVTRVDIRLTNHVAPDLVDATSTAQPPHIADLHQDALCWSSGVTLRATVSLRMPGLPQGHFLSIRWHLEQRTQGYSIWIASGTRGHLPTPSILPWWALRLQSCCQALKERTSEDAKGHQQGRDAGLAWTDLVILPVSVF